jgi:hypothetical protein
MANNDSRPAGQVSVPVLDVEMAAADRARNQSGIEAEILIVSDVDERRAIRRPDEASELFG